MHKTIAIVIGMLIVIAACDNSGSTRSTTTIATTAPTVTTPTSTSPSTTAPVTAATTSTSTTTTTTVSVEDALKAQVAADYERANLRRYEIFQHPTLDNLDALVAEVAVPGSERASAFKSFVEGLVAVGDVISVDVVKFTVEQVKLVGTGPYTEAVVTVCQVEQSKQITPAANSPTGSEIVTGGSEIHEAFRTDEPLRLTDQGWRPYQNRLDVTRFQGADSCPAV